MNMLTPDMVPTVLATGDPARVDANVPPKFKAGDRVTVVNLNQVAHNRLPAYIRGKAGTVTFDHGVFVPLKTEEETLGVTPSVNPRPVAPPGPPSAS